MLAHSPEPPEVTILKLREADVECVYLTARSTKEGRTRSPWRRSRIMRHILVGTCTLAREAREITIPVPGTDASATNGGRTKCDL